MELNQPLLALSGAGPRKGPGHVSEPEPVHCWGSQREKAEASAACLVRARLEVPASRPGCWCNEEMLP